MCFLRTPCNYDTQNLTKLRASDGANLGTFSVVSVPTTVAFDGANIWAPNLNSAKVTKLRADGAILGTFNVGNGPRVSHSTGPTCGSQMSAIIL